MGKVAISIKVMPANSEVDVEKIGDEIKKRLEVKDLKIEPIAFGLKALKVLVLVDDSEGSEKVEKTISSVDGVGEIEVESATLV